MAEITIRGKAQTVLGTIEGHCLGVTLPHEHLLCDISIAFAEPSAASDKALAYESVNLKILSWLRYHPYENLDNCRIWNEEDAIAEAMFFKKAGGNTIVDATSVGIGRDPQGLARISRVTGLNIIMGSGYYTGPSHNPALIYRTEEEVAEEIVRDINVGVGDTGIRAGIIGEIGCSWPLQEGERKILRAAVLAQKRTGAPINIHPGRNKQACLDIVDILDEAGADLNRVILSHIDARVRNHAGRCDLAKRGCTLEYDLCGWEGHFPSHHTTDDYMDLPNDTQRIYEILQLIEAGYLNQILISHDICVKSMRVGYGGWGYAHIINYMVPMMLKRGMSQEQIDMIMIGNPKRMLCFA